MLSEGRQFEPAVEHSVFFLHVEQLPFSVLLFPSLVIFFRGESITAELFLPILQFISSKLTSFHQIFAVLLECGSDLDILVK